MRLLSYDWVMVLSEEDEDEKENEALRLACRMDPDSGM